MNQLMSPFKCKGLELRNRVVMPPVCQYSAVDGMPNEWHYVHYTSRAIGGAGLIIVEITSVDPDGRITEQDLGLWSDEHAIAFKKIVESCHQYGSKIGIQISHAGRKSEYSKVPVSSMEIPFDTMFNKPKMLSTDEIKQVVEKFGLAAKRAVKAGFDTIELQGAHGYLIHQFHSPYINQRTDEYGLDRTKFSVEVIEAVKREMPADMPLIMRISAKEYVEGGYDVDYIQQICKEYEKAGVDIIHVSSGGEASYEESGMTPRGNPESKQGYQVPFAKAMKKTFNIPIIAVGRLEDAQFANALIENNVADLVAVGRGMLKNPYWPISAAAELEQQIPTSKQYKAAFEFKVSYSPK
ncbi:NADH:flavin oxidoreductase/NADH oxidase [Psychrobacillus sp. NPDC096623]|uniref:NADH:flavin oxidoreductase/NADH oxidase n=1 Tax=Psychrobacillus sp. NPDC096623 TaxID=3364492 RepID=UPI0037F4D447